IAAEQARSQVEQRVANIKQKAVAAQIIAQGGSEGTTQTAPAGATSDQSDQASKAKTSQGDVVSSNKDATDEGGELEPAQTEKDISAIVSQIVEAIPSSVFDFPAAPPPVYIDKKVGEIAAKAREEVENRHKKAADPTAVVAEGSKDILQDMKDNMRAFQSAL